MAAVMVLAALLMTAPAAQEVIDHATIAAIRDLRNYDVRTRHTNADSRIC